MIKPPMEFRELSDKLHEIKRGVDSRALHTELMLEFLLRLSADPATPWWVREQARAIYDTQPQED